MKAEIYLQSYDIRNYIKKKRDVKFVTILKNTC